MKICIVGAGAIGGFMGARLAAAGRVEVSALARGATLAALQTRGWQVNGLDGRRLLQLPARAAASAADIGVQDVVILAVKGPALAAVAPAVAALMGPGTVLLPAMNGVPWWFVEGEPLHSVDPGGTVAALLPAGQVVGCVVHISSATTSPGVVEHRMGQGLIIGEPAGGTSQRVQQLAAVLADAGFDATPSTDIRRDIWYKLWGNLTMNPVSAITGASSEHVLADPLVRGFCSAAMREASAIGARIGCPIAQQPEDRHAITARLGGFRSSMLQDAEAGRAIELDAIVGAVREIGQRLGVATPNIDALFGLARLFGRMHGLYPAEPPA